MAHKRNVPRPDKPRLRLSDWDMLGMYRYDHEGKRQALRIEPHYCRPPKVRTLRQVQHAQARDTGVVSMTRDERAEAKEYAEGLSAIANAEVGSVSPVRHQQLAEGFAAVGMDHLVF